MINLKSTDNRVILFLVLCLLFIWSSLWLMYPKIELEKTIVERPATENKQKTLADYFANLDLQATAYVVYDAETNQVLAAQNEREILALASITKVMTALALDELVDPQTLVTIGAVDYENYDNVGTLIPGETWQVNNLLALTLVGSSNYGAAALNQSTGGNLVEIMNNRAKDLSLFSLSFSNSTGLDHGSELGGQGSALDVARLFAYILKNKPQLFAATRQANLAENSADNFSHEVVNTNKIVNEIPGLLISKTGYTEIAGGNLAIAANLGLRRPTVFVVLGSTIEGRFTDIDKLIKTTLTYYADLNK